MEDQNALRNSSSGSGPTFEKGFNKVIALTEVLAREVSAEDETG